MEILKTVLQQMPNIHKPQLKFMLVLLPLLMCLNGRVNFRNLSRYSDYSEKTFSRWFRQPFDFVEFNRLSLLPLETPETQLIAATDCSFIPKSGKHTDGLGKFYNGAHKKAEKGLEPTFRTLFSNLGIYEKPHRTDVLPSSFQAL
jgi:putative transposase